MATRLQRILRAVREKTAQSVDTWLSRAERQIARYDDVSSRFLNVEMRSQADGVSTLALDPTSAPMGPRPPREEYKDIPISIWIDWKLQSVRGALTDHALGNFGRAAMLTEGMLSDDRVQAATNGRVKGVTKCEPVFVPADIPGGDIVAKDLTDNWDDILPDEQLEQVIQWAAFEGFALCEIVWDAWPIRDAWLPRLKIWHPLYIYYRVDLKRYIALTMEGAIEIDPDDPKWFLYVPFGAYRGWIRGAVRSCAIPWLIRQFALRDWARFSEVHGLPIRLAKYPAQAPAEDKARFFAGIRNLGAETTVGLPVQAGKDAAAWDVMLLEAKDRAWLAFPGLRDACDSSITLAIRGTNLTTSVGQGNSGNKAAAEVHREEDSDYAIADRKKVARLLRTHLIKWYCIFNYGNSELAPKKMTFIDPDGEDVEAELKNMSAGARAVIDCKTAGMPVNPREVGEKAGVPMRGEAPGQEGASDFVLAPLDAAVVVKVDEARAMMGLAPLGGEEGAMSIEAARQKAKPVPPKPFGGGGSEGTPPALPAAAE